MEETTYIRKTEEAPQKNRAVTPGLAYLNIRLTADITDLEVAFPWAPRILQLLLNCFPPFSCKGTEQSSFGQSKTFVLTF